MELEIVNVGQGNWNVFQIFGVNIFYDLGACKNESETNILNNIIKNNKKLFDREFGVVISHWDIDHYRLIISLEKLGYLKNMKFFVCPENLPTLTSEKAYKIIEAYLSLDDIYKIPNIEKGAIIGKRGETPYKHFEVKAFNKMFKKPKVFYKLDIITNSDTTRTTNLLTVEIRLYHSVERKNRNKNSLVMVINYSLDDYIVFTGDSYYRDLNEYIFKDLSSSTSNVHFVVPHHGGAAGKFMLDNLKFQKGKAFISVGKDNSYGHPNIDYVRDLKVQFGSENVLMTTDKEDNYKEKF
ncbi:hypothetical protein Q2490_15115 [Myroides odoratimimus]|uniref:hypothetical protein n=1 Tax=Myroides odoratimimus TaxID=76832 RepID=UPI0026E0690B|nr:hypothetical protein [Myroides odoratimimus]MDO5858614.1 hypothetical protein [Myroides odoratimimus]